MFPEASPQQEADRLLVERASQVNQQAFAELYDRLSGPLYSLCLRMIGDAAEAEDALQEAATLIWRRIPQYDPTRNSVFGWAVHLTRGKIIDRLRARGRRPPLFVPDPAGEETHRPGSEQVSEEPSPANATEEHDRAATVRRCLADLPGDQRQAIELAFFSHLTHQEIAARLAQPLGTVKARIRRGLLKLRDHLVSVA